MAPVGTTGSNPYAKVDDDNEGSGKPVRKNGDDSNLLSKDPLDEEISKTPEGPLRDELIFLRNSAGGVQTTLDACLPVQACHHWQWLVMAFLPLAAARALIAAGPGMASGIMAGLVAASRLAADGLGAGFGDCLPSSGRAARCQSLA